MLESRPVRIAPMPHTLRRKAIPKRTPVRAGGLVQRRLSATPKTIPLPTALARRRGG